MIPSEPFDQPQSPNREGTVQDRANIPLLFVGSLIVMIPWPLIAISLCSIWSLFEQDSDFLLMFGGVTMLFLFPLGMLALPEWVFIAIICAVWILVLFLPVFIAASRKQQRRHLTAIWILQAGFSIAQAGLGLLMIAGRNA